MAGLNPQETFDRLRTETARALETHFPVEGKKQTLRLKAVDISDAKDIDDVADQKDAKLKGRTWGVPIKANVELVDNKTGKVVDSSTMQVGTLPKPTRRFSYIVNGEERQVQNQLRLKSGVYTRETEAGELKQEWNLARGKGFSMSFNPEKRRFKMQYDTKTFDAYPVLKTLGVDDDTLERAWGKEILDANRVTPRVYESAVKDLHKKLVGTSAESMEDAAKGIRENYGRTELRPDSTRLTLGKELKTVDGAAIVAGAKKLLDVTKGKDKPDERDQLQFKDLMGPEDLLAERLETRGRFDIQRKLKRKLDSADSVRKVVTPDTFNRAIGSFFSSSNLSDRPKQLNPIGFISGHRRTTVFGEGGIGSDNMMTLDAQSINPSQMGFLDPVQTPESARIGGVLQLALGTKKDGRDIKTRVYNLKTGKNEWVTPETANKSVVAFPDQFQMKGGKMIPRSGEIKAMDADNEVRTVRPGEVQYVLSSPKGMFDISANSIPFLQNNQGNRTSVAAKQLEQAVALADREEPLVQNKTEGAFTFEKVLGELNSHSAPADGKVVDIKDDHMVIQGADKKRHKVQLYRDFPVNDNKSAINSNPLVKVGDTVKKNQVVADTNFTKNGKLALGKNLEVSYMPYRGYNFEDGIVISEGAAKKLTSEHMTRHSIQTGDSIILNKKKFMAETAGQWTKDQAKKLGDDGVIQVGQTVKPGDPLIAKLKKTDASRELQQLQKLSKKAFTPVKAQPVTWESDYEGEVVDVVRHGKDVAVHVKSKAPAVIGDKLVGRHGNKGIITCVDSSTYVLTDQGWKLFKDLSRDELICTLNPDTRKIEYQKPTAYIDEPHDGPMYVYEGRRLNLKTTPEHSHYVRTRHGEYRLVQAKDCAGKPRIHLRTGEWEAPDLEEVVIPGRPDGKNLHKKFCEPRAYDADLFLEFFGYWVTEGCLNNSNHIHVAQDRDKHPETYERIKEVLEDLGYSVGAYPKVLIISDPRLHHWLSQFGKAKDKFIPREFLNASPRQLRILVDALFDGDGGVYFREKDNHTRHELFTSSKQLADDYQELALKTGWSANVKPQNEDDGVEYIVRWSMKEEVWTNNDRRYSNERWEHYKGRVYCVDVPNHIIYIRREGIPVWSGNCIVPDHEMPQKEDGNSVDILLNPTGIGTRINLGQCLETAAAKIARKTGKPYVVDNFNPDIKDYTEKVQKDLKAAGLRDKETVVDPVTGDKYETLTGPQYMLKLEHMAEKGVSARNVGAYDSNFQPRQGGKDSGVTMDSAGLYSLLAHGSRENIKEFQAIKGEKNDDYWIALQNGETPPPPQTPFAYRKFEGYLKSMGVDVQKNGNRIQLGPLTDDQILDMSNGEITKPDIPLKHSSTNEIKPERGSLFDPKITGTRSITHGLGEKWGHIKLEKRLPNPTFEKPVRTLLGLKQKDFDAIMEGKKDFNGKTGPDAVTDALRGVNVKTELDTLMGQIPNLKGKKLSDATQKVKYLRVLNDRNIDAHKAYTLGNIPVLPPKMRPVTVLDSGDIRTDDITDIYRHLGAVNTQVREMKAAGVPDDVEEAKELAHSLYDGMKALNLSGMEFKQRHRKGIAELIGGRAGQTAPKEAFFQSKVIGKRQDMSMRGVIVPEPNLSMDEVAIPEKAALVAYKPFVMRRMRQAGYKPGEAIQAIKKKDPVAMKMLEAELGDRPIMLKRDPVLHKYGVQAFKPKLTKGNAIKIHPLATSGYNADFDGDKMSAYVPVSSKAVDEAWNMLPSRNLFSPSDGKIMFKPSHESLLGLHQLTRTDGKRTGLKFKTEADAAKAAAQGKIKMTDVITIQSPGTKVQDNPLTLKAKEAKDKTTTVGRILIEQSLPEDHRHLFKGQQLDKGKLDELLSEVGKKSDARTFAQVADTLKDMGNEHATGFGFGLDDLKAVKGPRDKILNQVKAEEKKIHATVRNKDKRNEKLAVLYDQARQKLDAEMKPHFDKSDNKMYQWVKAKARGNWDQFKQMTVTPMAVVDSKERIVPIAIDKSYSEGLDTASYWASMYGARKGTIGRVKGTALPGAQVKEMMQTSMDQMVTTDDCGTKSGQHYTPGDKHAVDRVLATDVNLGTKGGKNKGVIKAGEVLTPELLTRMKNNGVKSFTARTPLKCDAHDGVCSHCYGLNETGHLPEKGDNLGVKAVHAIGEPLTQMAMNAFHTGGVAGARGSNVASQFDRVVQLVQFPKKLPGAAKLSSASGKVQKVQKDPTVGGWDVYVDGKKHHVGAKQPPVVRVGQEIKKGDALTEGPKNPIEMLPLTGIGSVRSYVTDELSSLGGYSGSPQFRRNAEVFVRSLTNLNEVKDPGDHPAMMKGDRVSGGEVKSYNAQQGAKPVKASPVLKGTNVLPLELQSDWMAKLQYKELRRTLTDAAAEGWTSDIHGVHPVPAMAYGKEVGKGTKKDPWKY